MAENDSEKAEPEIDNTPDEETETVDFVADSMAEAKPSIDVDAALKDQLEAAIAERDENHDRWLRLQAEMENYRRRMNQQAADQRKYQSLDLARDILPALDNLQRALGAAESSGNVSELIEGIGMVLQQFDGILNSHSATRIKADGEVFDPNLHQAIQQIPSADHEPMTVMQEVQSGYQMHDRVVRPASVIVSCAMPESSKVESGDNSTDESEE